MQRQDGPADAKNGRAGVAVPGILHGARHNGASRPTSEERRGGLNR